MTTPASYRKGQTILASPAAAATALTGDPVLVAAIQDVLLYNPGPLVVNVLAGDATAQADATCWPLDVGQDRLCPKGGATHLSIYCASGTQQIVAVAAGATPVAPANLPSFKRLPIILGEPSIGVVASFLPGEVIGTEPITRTQAWYLDDVQVATTATYTPTAKGILTVKETATNAAGSQSAISMGVLTKVTPPAITTAPVITSALPGAAPTYTPAASTSNPSPTITYFLIKNGVTVAAGATAIAAYTSIVATDSLVIRAIPSSENGTGAPVDSAAYVVPAAPTYPTIATLGYLGANIQASVDYKPTPQYNNLIRDTRGFEAYDQSGNPATLDENGWPAGPANLVISTNQYGAINNVGPGTYYLNVKSTGQAVQITGLYNVTVGAPTLLSDGLTSRYPITVPSSADGSTIANIGVRCDRACWDWDMARDGSTSTAGQPTYYEPTLALYCSYDMLRMMDWLNTNLRLDTTWGTRPPNTQVRPFGSATFTFPWEELVALTKALVAHPNSRLKAMMICLPFGIDDNYVEQLPALLTSLGFPSTVQLFIQVSNEVWNPQFNAYHYFCEQAMLAQQMMANYETSNAALVLTSVTGDGTNLTCVAQSSIDSWFPGAAGATLQVILGSDDTNQVGIGIGGSWGINQDPTQIGQPIPKITATKVDSKTFRVPCTATTHLGNTYVIGNPSSDLLADGIAVGAWGCGPKAYVKRTHQIQQLWSVNRPQDHFFLDQISVEQTATDVMWSYADYLGGGAYKAGTWLYGTAVGFYIAGSSASTTLDELFAEFDTVLKVGYPDRQVPSMEAAARRHISNNKQRGMHPLGYEWAVDMQQCYSLVKGAMADPRMGLVTTKIMDVWFQNGGEHFCYYHCTPGAYDNSQQGSWPIMQTITDTASVRYAAIMAYRNKTIDFANWHGAPGDIVLSPEANRVYQFYVWDNNNLVGTYRDHFWVDELVAIPYPGGNYTLTAVGGNSGSGNTPVNYSIDDASTVAAHSTLRLTGGFGTDTADTVLDVLDPVTVNLSAGVHALRIAVPYSFNAPCLRKIKMALVA